MKKSSILTLILSGIILASCIGPVFAGTNMKSPVTTCESQIIETVDNMDFNDFIEPTKDDTINMKNQATTCVSQMIKIVDNIDFNDFIEPIKDNLSKDEIKKLKKLHEDAIKLDKKEKFDQANKLWDEIFSITDKYEFFNGEPLSFKDFIKDLDGAYDKNDLAKIEKIYNKILDLEKSNKYDEANELWNDLFELLEDDVVVNIEDLDFKDFIKDFSKDLKEGELKELENLYNQALELDKKGKYDEANELWNKLFHKLDENIDWEECETIN
ncbi:MAG: hypothetical protein N4A57_04990 [Anaeromicrobium sp.]|jgi:TolA-binding protein|uniref:hypothetical protein n=1 Tax=Anaeromicrobium sp. TaxID=1929132 RepID=UPI0025F75EF5|nr:hypothetical protein [Anaeromicrobium sp.]MCT4593612.1 hypothetical protein [Anaeromicrobium sp.]